MYILGMDLEQDKIISKLDKLKIEFTKDANHVTILNKKLLTYFTS